MELTDAHLEDLEERGYIILPGFRHGEELKQMQEAQRRVLPSWEQVKDDPPSGHSTFADFPPPEIALLHGIVHHQAWDFARKWFDSEHIHFRAGSMIARYPSFKGGGTGSDAGALHLDNGNNSLLPPSDSARAFGQLVFWHHLEEVAEDQAPLRLIPKEHGRDMSKAEPLICEAGTLCVFTNYTMHSASDYLRADGQRYTWGFGLGRADHYWEGFRHYTDKGKNPIFCEFIGALTAAEREVFRFPPAGHAYYTPQTLTALEEQYPGWNARSEY
jgi:hypothetical protein